MGSVLAYAVTAAAASLTMAARVSETPGLAAQTEALRDRAAPLAQRDEEAYDAALAIRDASEAMPPDQRDWEIGRAIAMAAEPLLDIARAAADVAEIAAHLAESGDPRIRADAVAAAALAAGAARGTVILVSVNLTALGGDPRVAEAARLADGAEESARMARLLVS
jgi:formiminotetrahydrofolate cyclodeaminase